MLCALYCAYVHDSAIVICARIKCVEDMVFSYVSLPTTQSRPQASHTYFSL